MALMNMAEVANVSLIPMRISRECHAKGTETGSGVEGRINPEVSGNRQEAIRGDMSHARSELIPYRQADRLNAARTV